MTVEQSPLDRFTSGKQQHQPPLLSSDKDVAQSPTSGVIDLTNDSSDKEEDLKKAIALSLKEHERVLGGQVSMEDQDISSSDKEEDLKKAIELSLKEHERVLGRQVSVEDQDISRVVEASLAESKAVGTKRKRGESWQDPVNPHDRKRNGDWPVGLKNVGNTCWFSAVIQSLFNLPIFRKLVLSYSPQDWSITATDAKEKRNLLFMQELRKLFALLSCSKRKYVDPSHALEELKEAFPDSSGTDSQQDVSEFSHKLLEWLEEAFKMKSYFIGENGVMMDGPEQNPMLNLFYGHFLSEGHNGGRMFCNEETFGQYPLQVNGFNNIHESLEAAVTQEIESTDVMTRSGQESWFTRLPPVMLFELSRFQFNQQLGRPEKIHNKLEFPQIMYMDRYMEENKNTTRGIRDKVRKLKEEREKLHHQLEKYLNYGSGSKKVPLHDVLQYTLDFAESRRNGEEANPSEDVEMASPASVSSMGGDSPSNSPNKPISMEVSTNPSSTLNISTSLNSNGFLHTNNCDETVPSPQHVTEVELKVLQQCLKRWRKEIETNVKNLQDGINIIDNTIREIYNDPTLQKKPYRLHAVLVHEGQAASGHYWAYVYCPKKKIWLKFNDVTVSEATWIELQKDSMGGHHCASAYCLLYVDDTRSELFDESRDFQIGPEHLSNLPVDLQQFVEEDNTAFLVEMEQWDFEQSRKKDSSTMTVADTECTIIAERKLVTDENNTGPFISSLSMEHAISVHKTTVSRTEQFRTSQQQGESIFAELLRLETLRLKRVARVPITSDNGDCRLQHAGVYIILNEENPDPYLTLCITEQFLVPELEEVSNGLAIKEAALNMLQVLRNSLKEEHFVKYTQWHQEYSQFRKAAYHFVAGIEHFFNKNYIIALTSFSHCFDINQALCKLPGNRRGLDSNFIHNYRRESVLRLNEICANRFENLDEQNAFEALSTAKDYIIPSMEFLSLPTASDKDRDTADKIRNQWCSLLGFDIASRKMEKLQDFLSTLLDPSSDSVVSHPFPKVSLRISNLEEEYKQTLKQIEINAENQALCLSSMHTK